MTASQIRAEAREKLASKWGKSAFITLLFLLMIYFISRIFNLDSSLGYLAFIIIALPLCYGFVFSFCELNEDISISCLDFIKNGFTHFGKAWSITFNIALKLILPILLILACDFIHAYGYIDEINYLRILGLVLYIMGTLYILFKQFSYRIALLVLYDNPSMSGKEAVEKSAELMKGNVGALLCLDLSFIGWAILAIATLGIGFLWLIPYIQVSEINFYKNLTGELKK